jgi:hypothetical protein
VISAVQEILVYLIADFFQRLGDEKNLPLKPVFTAKVVQNEQVD